MKLKMLGKEIQKEDLKSCPNGCVKIELTLQEKFYCNSDKYVAYYMPGGYEINRIECRGLKKMFDKMDDSEEEVIKMIIEDLGVCYYEPSTGEIQGLEWAGILNYEDVTDLNNICRLVEKDGIYIYLRFGNWIVL